MRRPAVIALSLTLAGVTAGAASGASIGVPVIAKSKASVRVRSCSLADRSAVFYARMRKLRGTRRMRMRFTLLERAKGATQFKRVHAPGLSHWRKSAEGVRAYGYSQEVRGLQEGAVYRMRVRYRWYNKHNEVQRRTRRTSRKCRMFVPLANLRLRILDGNAFWRYRVRVLNSGHAAADDIPVQLFVNGRLEGTKIVDHLEPGSSTPVGFNGPACRGNYGFQVDPEGTIAEANEADDRVSRSC